MARVYIGDGWFVERRSDESMVITKLSADPFKGGGAPLAIVVQGFIAVDEWVDVLAAITGRTVEEARAFWTVRPPGRPP